MAFTHCKEYARWIAEAKRAETRQRRVAQALEMIRAGKTRSRTRTASYRPVAISGIANVGPSASGLNTPMPWSMCW